MGELYRVLAAERGRSIHAPLTGSGEAAAARLVTRSAMHRTDPREVVLAVFARLPPEQCRSTFDGLRWPPVSLLASPAVLSWHRDWREERRRLAVGHESGLPEAAFQGAILETEHRIGLLTRAGVARPDAIRAGALSGFLRPEWLLAYPEERPDLDGYNETDRTALLLLEEQARRSWQIRRMIARVR